MLPLRGVVIHVTLEGPASGTLTWGELISGLLFCPSGLSRDSSRSRWAQCTINDLLLAAMNLIFVTTAGGRYVLH